MSGDSGVPASAESGRWMISHGASKVPSWRVALVAGLVPATSPPPRSTPERIQLSAMLGFGLQPAARA